MREDRKKAKKYLQSIRTVKELTDYLDLLTISEEDKQIILDVYVRGLSHTQIAAKNNCSVEKVRRSIQRILDKVL